ncbi:hypothetical protein [Pelagibius sp. 7325]|uniref:hypothetical protein n=1 Tax=Pelagibius sp. 7325 TaxID=3131994 RepID=UPI0030EE54C8
MTAPSRLDFVIAEPSPALRAGKPARPMLHAGEGEAMPEASKRSLARVLLQRYPKSPADRLKIEVSQDKPAVLFRWLVASLLFSARIGADQAESAAGALFAQGWRTPQKMAKVTWARRVKVLNRAGYARYDESTSRYIADSTEMLLERYGGDLRRLRQEAGHDPARERMLVKQFKGIGDVGADIFFREVQCAWPELYPFADKRALQAAAKVGLGKDAADLARAVERKSDLPRLLAALVAADLAKKLDDVRREAG